MSVRKGSKIIAGAYAVIKPDVYVKTEVDDLLDKKQDKLIAGTNIFIGDDNVISATGGSGGYINIVQETGNSTDDVMSQASVTHELEQKVNTLDLADIAFTSDYNDLSNTPDLAIYTKTEDLAEVAFTGDYDDLGNTPDLTLYAKTEDLSKVAVSNNYEDLDDKPNLNVYDTVVSVNNKLSFKQDNLKAGYGISIEDNTISNTVDTVEWGKIIGDISTQEDLQGEFTAIRNTIKDSDDNSLNKTQVTNCLLEVPQRIKYDLTDGILTIKAGSVAIVPYGTEDLTADYPVGSTFLNDNFKVYDTQFADGKFFVWAEVQSDIVDGDKTAGDNNIRPLQVDITQNNLFHFSKTTSGTTDYNDIYNASVYRTDLNIIKKWETNIGLTSNVSSFPICTIKSNVSTKYVYESIPQVFNGMGDIGSTVWVDKGVKGLISNEKNEDGTYKNIEWINDRLLMTNGVLYNDGTSLLLLYGTVNPRIAHSKYLGKYDVAPSAYGSNGTYYNTKENVLYYNTGSKWVLTSGLILGDMFGTGTTISSFIPKQPFRAVDWSDLKDVIRIGQPQLSLDNVLPSNCVWLEGSTVSRTTYASLFAIYGTTYGAGDGSKTFVLPDFRNRAIWGSNGFGYLSAGLPNITGGFNATELTDGSEIASGAFYVGGMAGRKTGGGGDSEQYGFSFNASRSSSIYGSSSTVQPPAIKVRVYTRYQ